MPTRKPTARKPAAKSTRRPGPLKGPLSPNAAELWAATLPTPSELAIQAERVRRTERVTPVVAAPCELTEDFTIRPSYGWALGSVALMAAVVAACAWGTGLLHHLL
jgi:cobalamin synthase